MSRYVKWVTVMLICIMLSVACKKDKVPNSIAEQDIWELRSVIAGDYKVYDTLGNYLYEMQISRIKYSTNSIADSLRFENFDNEFSFTVEQYKWSNRLMGVRIGSHNILYDTNNKRWKIHSGLSDIYNNFENDTIRLRFQKTNINYWVEDAVPYYVCDCKQIAVKQH